jgi:hypothetical protein
MSQELTPSPRPPGRPRLPPWKKLQLFNVYFPPALLARVKALAARDGMSASRWVKLAVERACAAVEA